MQRLLQCGSLNKRSMGLKRKELSPSARSPQQGCFHSAADAEEVSLMDRILSPKCMPRKIGGSPGKLQEVLRIESPDV